MNKTVLAALAGALMVLQVSQVQAEGLDAKRFYAGGGLAFNSLPGFGSARGFQFFGGYELATKLNDDISTALELGYMDSGKFDQYDSSAPNKSKAKGLWLSAVEMVPLTSKAYMQARLGYDFGDDDGFLVGAGLAYRFDTRITLKSEYVVRENINGLQFNLQVGF
ncbi:MAG TPA: hypothetical protein ENJ64_02425 [Thiotrichales bacterium]|nr:hypothetical protein [Thiotrichales bacterium]